MNKPLVIITGPTASGKSSLALDIARRFNGEIICADSRSIYKGMDIGTAKPTIHDQNIVVHWGLDIVEPNERFTAADFKKYADRKIHEIQKNGRLPILVGGTGLYVNAVLFGYEFGSIANEKLRSELQQMSLQQLYDYCKDRNINLPENDKNKRYIIRAIENSANPAILNNEPVYKNIIVGITTEKKILRQHIEKRIEQQLENGVVDEAIRLGKKYGWEIESMTSNIYPFIKKYIEKSITIDELKTQAATADWHLAKRQLTWLKRNAYIHWDSLEKLNNYLSERLVSLD